MIAAALRAAVQPHAEPRARLRLRLRLRVDGELAVEIDAHPATRPGPVRLAVDTERVDPDWLWLHHKTNRREIYEAARARHRNVDDIVLVNSHGRITETTIATIALHLETAGGLRR